MIRVGILGAGWVAENVHIPQFKKMENVKIEAIYDVELERAKVLSEIVNAVPVRELTDLDCFKLDAVVICTPNSTHAELAAHFLERNKHVLCEKPLANNLTEVLRIKQAYQKSKGVFLVGFVNRYRKDIQALKGYLQDGLIGNIQFLSTGWRRKLGVPRQGSWFTNRRYSGGGVLNDLGSHIIDQIFYLSGAEDFEDCFCKTFFRKIPDSRNTSNWLGNAVSDYSDVEDTAIGSVRLSNGVVANFWVSWADDIEGDFVELWIRGTKGSLQLRTLFGFSNQGLYRKPELFLFLPDGTKNKLPLPSFEPEDRHEFQRQAIHFVDCVMNGAQPLITLWDGERTVKLIQSLYASSRKDKRVHA